MVRHFAFGSLPNRPYPAAVIVEPVRTVADHDWLRELREFCTKSGTALVFDETITGLRFHRGGYQAVCGVRPDMAVFGKALANGLPLAVLVGDRYRMARPVFASPTFATEPMALKAAIAVQRVFDRVDVAGIILEKGRVLLREVGSTMAFYEKLGIELVGLPPWTIVRFRDRAMADADTIRTRLAMLMIQRGHLVNGQHFVNLGHTDDMIASLVAAYDDALASLTAEYEDGELIDPAFRVCRTILPLPGRP